MVVPLVIVMIVIPVLAGLAATVSAKLIIPVYLSLRQNIDHVDVSG